MSSIYDFSRALCRFVFLSLLCLVIIAPISAARFNESLFEFANFDFIKSGDLEKTPFYKQTPTKNQRKSELPIAPESDSKQMSLAESRAGQHAKDNLILSSGEQTHFSSKAINNFACTVTSINIGQTVSDSLSTTDCFGNTRYFDQYTFSGTAGQAIRITLQSAAFATLINIFGTNNQLINFTNRGTGTTSILELTLPSTGTYLVYASSLQGGVTGSYTLSINTFVCPSTPISVGQTISNVSLATSDCLDRQFYYDDYEFFGTAGQQVIISMNSTAFDTYLGVVNSNHQLLAVDNDSGGGTNARIAFTPTVSGTYIIEASSFLSNAVGAYTISLSGNTSANCAPQPTGIIGWYKGEGNLTDSSGNHNYNPFRFGFNNFNGSYSAGKVGQAFDFNGTSNSVYVIESPTPRNSITREISLAAWIKPTTINGQQTIVSKYDVGGNGVSFYFSANGGKLYFQVNQSNTVNLSYTTTNNVLTAGVYQHVAATFNSATQLMQIFVNGTSVPVTLVNAGTVNSVQGFFTTLNLGALATSDTQNTQYFGGQIDEIQIFNRLLSTTEIQSIYNAGSSGVCNNFIVSGKITTAAGRSLLNVPVSNLNGSRIAQYDALGQYNIFLEQGLNQTVVPKLSTHSFSPNYSFNPLTGNQTGRDFTATLINDNFASAVSLTGESGEIDGNNEDATRESGEPLHADVVGGTSVWYKWQAPRNGQFIFSLGGSDFDTLLAVYTGTSVTSLTKIAANDDIPDKAGFSSVTFQATANTDYYIAVDGRAKGSGSGYFKMIYHPQDYTPGFTISGTVKFNDPRQPIDGSVLGATIKAENLDGGIIATTVAGAGGTYTIVIPQGVNSFKLTAFDNQYIYGFAIFSNITQSQTYNFFKPPFASFFIASGQIIGVNNLSDLKITAKGNGSIIDCSPPSDAVLFGDEYEYVCPGLLPNGTYTITPSFPSSTFTPESLTFTKLSGNIINASFVNNNAPGFNISGKVTQGTTPLNGATVKINLGLAPAITVETDISGNYSAHIPAGKDVEVTARLSGFSFAQRYDFLNLQSDKTADFNATSNCSYALSALQPSVSAAGGFFNFNITTNAGCAWEAKTKSTGFTVTTPLSFGSGTISYFVEANTGAARTGTITVAGQTFTISQAAGKSRKRVRFF